MYHYRCNKCQRIFERDGKANGQGRLVSKPPVWMKSFCTETGKDARLYLVKHKKR